MEDRYPPYPYAGNNPVNPYRQPNNANSAYMQNSPHSVGAARAAGKYPASDPQVGPPPYYAGAADRMQTPNTGAMPYMNVPNTKAMPYTAENPNTGMMPQTANPSNAGAAGQTENTDCGYKMGTQPWCAPLSAGYVPFQQENPPKYTAGDALTRGTLFPGLDLPYLNIVNKDHPYAGTPLGELMSLDFVIRELNLYLDTHPDDTDALMMLQSMNKLMAEGSARYEKTYGPITISNLVSGDAYTWLENPWPWDYMERPVKD